MTVNGMHTMGNIFVNLAGKICANANAVDNLRNMEIVNIFMFTILGRVIGIINPENIAMNLYSVENVMTT